MSDTYTDSYFKELILPINHHVKGKNCQLEHRCAYVLYFTFYGEITFMCCILHITIIITIIITMTSKTHGLKFKENDILCSTVDL